MINENYGKYLLVGLLATVFLISLVYAEIQSIGPFAKGQCITLYQTCNNCTFNNISSVLYPNGSYALSQTAMTKNGVEYNYSNYCLTNEYGKYTVNGFGDPDGLNQVWSYDFRVTPSGDDDTSSGKSIILLGSLFTILVLSITFLLTGLYFENTAARAALISLAGIGFLVSILYTMVIMTQYLAQNPTIVSSYENFLFVVKILASIGVIALIIVAFLVFVKAWKIKRGLKD